MSTTLRKIGLLFVIVLGIGFMQSCKNKEPSIVKIYVRSSSNQLVTGAKVILIGDITSNPLTIEDVDTLITNGSGFAEFNMEDHFNMGDDEYEVAYFDVIAKTTSLTGTGYIRTRVHTTAVETVYLP